LKDAQAQNDLLHSQLETLGQLAEKNQAARVSEAAGDAGTDAEGSGDSSETNALNKTITELREVVRFLRSEKEMLHAQVDAAKRTAERERAAATVIKRSLEEARAELQVLTTSVSKADVGESELRELKNKLNSSEDQLNLLRDSNQLMREESEKLQKSLALLKSELEASKKATEPAEKRHRELAAEKAALEMEKESLKREIDSWKGRVQSLVSNFNQVSLPPAHYDFGKISRVMTIVFC